MIYHELWFLFRDLREVPEVAVLQRHSRVIARRRTATPSSARVAGTLPIDHHPVLHLSPRSQTRPRSTRTRSPATAPTHRLNSIAHTSTTPRPPNEGLTTSTHITSAPRIPAQTLASRKLPVCANSPRLLPSILPCSEPAKVASQSDQQPRIVEAPQGERKHDELMVLSFVPGFDSVMAWGLHHFSTK